MKRWTTREVARLAGVSPATVSRVLNDNPSVAPALVKKVQEAIRQLEGGTDSDQMSTPKRIGVAFPRRLQAYEPDPMGGAFYGQILTGMDEVLREGGHTLSVSPYDPADPPAGLVADLQDRFDGLVLMGADTPDDLAREASRRNLPVIVVDKQVRGVDSVVSDNVGGAAEVTAYLLEAGYRDLVYLCETFDDPSFAARRQGFEQAVAASRLPVRTRALEVGRGWLSAPQVLGDLIQSADGPVAVVAGNDMTALHILALSRARGVAVPEELALTGFDDIALARKADPPLTTVRIDKVEMGRLTARRLLERFSLPDLLPITITMHVAVVVRDSARRR